MRSYYLFTFFHSFSKIKFKYVHSKVKIKYYINIETRCYELGTKTKTRCLRFRPPEIMSEDFKNSHDNEQLWHTKNIIYFIF